MIDKAYKILLKNENILSLLQLAKLFDVVSEESNGGRPYQRFCKQLYERYGKDNVKKITISRRAKHAADKQWQTRSRVMPEETKYKIKQSNKKVWDDDDGTRREVSRRSMIENALPISHQSWVRQKAIDTRKKRDKWANYTEEGYKSLVKKSKNKIVTEESRNKMSTSAKKRGNNLPDGFQHSDETKKKLSKITKKQWEDGIHTPTFKSRGQLEIVDFLQKNGYRIEEEFLVDGRPFDVKVNDLLIEFNGTYWHLDPRFYEKDYYDKSRDILAEEIWNRDADKQNIAINNGYRFMTVWQYDLENNKEETLQHIINKI